MSTSTTVNPHNYSENKNNPTKEILASSGIWDNTPYAPTPYAVDIPNSLVPNTGINTTTTSSTTSSTTSPPSSGSDPSFGIISSGNLYIDDMLIFNDYIHYASTTGIKRFNPQTFLQQAVTAFNAYGSVTGVPV